MANLVSSWSRSAKTVPRGYVFPLGWRPERDAPICKEIPVIDLSLATGSKIDRAKIAQQILKALDEYRGFQVINHGVPDKLMKDAMEVYNEFFNLPVAEKEKYISDGTHYSRRGLYGGADDPASKNHFWRDTLNHECYPLEQYVDTWPEDPPHYREVMTEYVIETRKVSQMIFELIADGLGIEKEYFTGELTKAANLRVNYYPKCPDPSLTCGICVHYDPNMVTLLQQNVPGLQLLKDEKWLVVDPLPNAFFVLTGQELEIISNGRFKATLHQVATNSDADRLSIGFFVSAPKQETIKPANAFVSDENPPKYKDYSFEKYVKMLTTKGLEGVVVSGAAVAKSAFDSFLI